ncbi:exocyst complex component exo84 [Savitreella phatthalungensis]
MASLRKKKTNDALPRRISTFDGMPTAPQVVVGSKEKNKVQDKIKRRLSVRMGLPTGQRQQRPALPPGALSNLQTTRLNVKPPLQSSERKASVPYIAPIRPVYDPVVFNDPNFDAESYVKRMLQTATPTELDDFFQTLQEQRTTNSGAQQRDTFSNHREFITISKEVSTLDTDVSAIRNMLGELRGVAQRLAVDTDQTDLGRRDDGRRAGRNSIVDFHQLNKNNLQLLWQQVEGSRKFLPAEEGRRVVRESGAWTELNSATWRVKQKVHVVLLNDHILLAARRQKPNGSGQRLIAQRCFSLMDVQISELRDKEMEDAIMIHLISTRDKFVLRADTLEEKRVMYLAMQRELAELEAGVKRESQLDLERSTGRVAQDTSRQGQIKRLSRRLSKRIDKPTTTTGVNGEQIDLTWIQERIDDLDQKIAHRQYSAAVRSLHRGRALVKDASADDLAGALVALRLDERADHLAARLAEELSQEALSRRTRVITELVGCLSSIDRSQLAHETFFAARTELIVKRLGGIQFEGDVLLYISDVSLVHFHLIRQTAVLYNETFASNRELSIDRKRTSSPSRASSEPDRPTTVAVGAALIAWARDEADKFADVFSRQLYGMATHADLYQEALAAVSRNISTLRDIGMDLSFWLQHRLAQRADASANDDIAQGMSQLTVSA